MILMAVKVPFEAVLHFRSPAGLVIRAGAPGEVLAAVQRGLDARSESVHGAFALTVKVGPAVALKPASKSAGVGAVRGVDPALTCNLTTLPAVIDTLPGLEQLAGAPLAVHCAVRVDGLTHAIRAIAVSAVQRLVLFIVSPARLERFRKT
jgi:hypothetical protein